MALNRDDARLVLRELRTKMGLATEGRLTYGKEDDVYRCISAPGVFELRMTRRVQFPNDEVRAVRLYFAEPDELPHVLLAAKLGAKPATPEGLKLQNDQMLEAKLRVEHHLGL